MGRRCGRETDAGNGGVGACLGGRHRDRGWKGYPKKGNKTAGVGRQYCGQTGKIDNCVVAVHLGYADGDFHCLLDSELYLPEDWIDDRERRQEARIPEGATFRTKVQIALGMTRRALEDGVKLKWLLGDEEDGRSSDFRNGVRALGLHYLVEVPRNTLGWTQRLLPREATLNRRVRRQRPLTKGTKGARRVDELWHRGGPRRAYFRVKETEKGPLVWEARVCRFFPLEKHRRAGEACWLIVAHQPSSGETKYFLSDAPDDTPREPLLRIAFERRHVERVFQDGKGEIGLGHFEARLYPAIKRHFVLSQLSFLFLAGETQRLRKKTFIKPVSSEKSRRSATGAWFIERAKTGEIGTIVPNVRVSASPQSTSSKEPSPAANTSASRHRNHLIAAP